MKSLAIAQLMAVKELRREGLPLARSLVFLATGDEERDSFLGTRRILHQHPDLAARFDVVLTEGGAVEATDIDEVKYWGTENRQKLYVEMRVCSDNRGALEGLREDLARPQDEARGRPRVLPPRVVEELRSYVASRQRPDFVRFFDGALAWRGTFSALPPNVQAMMRNDLAAFPVEDDPDAGGYSMRLILQLLPWQPLDEAVESVLPGGLPAFATAAEIPHGPIPVGGLDHPIFDFIERHLQKVYPEFVHGPLFIAWAATDARFFRAAGIPAYGFSPFLILSGDAAKMTGPNERMVAPAFLQGVELYQQVVRDWVR
jgi:acetylornithine deacetylase/succinyl-diaminopimelate desuccinylase-like protein